MYKKVAIVAEWLTSRGGAENVVFELAQIFPDADIFTTIYNKKLFPELKGRTVRTSFLQKIPILNKQHQWCFFMLPRAIESLDLSGYDLIISSSSAFGKGIKKDQGALHICYCHTPMRWVWEPQRDNRLSRLPFNNKIRKWLKAWDLKSNDRVDIFCANSRYTAEKIKKYYQRNATILYPPVDLAQFSQVKNSRTDYFFSIGRLIPYKRVDLAIRSCNKIGQQLLIAGTGPEQKKLRKIAGDKTVFLGHINSTDKKRYLACAKAIIFCADEDFGIVPVESIASGTPVIAYQKGGAKEIIQDGVNGVFFNKQNPESLLSAIAKFDRIKFNQKTLRQSVQKFDKIKFRKGLVKLIKKRGYDGN